MLTAPVALALQPAAAEPAAPATDEAELSVPQLPADASPEELMAFVEGLLPPKRQPKSREEMFAYIKGVSQVAVEAADKVLGQVKEDEELFAKAARLKLESLSALARLGEEKAAADMAAFAAKLAESPVKPLAMEAKRMLIVAEAQKMFQTGEFDGAGAIVTKTAALLEADPDDLQTAGLAMQLAGALEQMPGGGDVAVTAIKTFGPLFAKSGNERVQQLAEGFQGKLRLLELPGKPMEIKGALLDGGPFDQAKFAGKVVLVDFWATWCGPCVAEIPNMLEQYEKYHDKGFEVVGISLDEDKAAVEKFVTDNKIPWPILFAGKGWQDPVAQFYGISGIPQLVLIGRDGNVITLDCRGAKLGAKLAELFTDAADTDAGKEPG
ncbi:MAG: TlpA family protein disulfide reductase [Planctomycetota bacterium]